ncbi:MAG: DMT family transporter [Rhodocyclaceae bacterium]|nr:DMT family transporter [Rhodocyclaceae bacterium]
MSRTSANALLLLAALIWGTTFVAQQIGMQDVGPLAFTGIRFLLGALIILPLAWREYARLAARQVAIDRHDVLSWIGLGVLLFCGATFQQIGLLDTTVSNAGFLTALYVPMVPLLAWIIDRHRPHAAVWPAALGSVCGTFLLSGGELAALTVGDYWVLSSTIFWAAHILWVGRLAMKKGTPILVAFSQFVTCGVLASIGAVATETTQVAGVVAALPTILYSGLLSVGVAFTLQVVAQRHTRAPDAAILLSAETLFAAGAGAIFLGERLSVVQLSGGALIFACILFVQLAPLIMARPIMARPPPAPPAREG